MASQSSKKIATANSQTLKELHLISLLINSLVILSLFLFHRPASKWKFVVFSLPALGCQLVLEKSGRPIYSLDSLTHLSKLVKSGDDIKGPGLFEYMFDCIYVTWFCDILMILFGSNKVWVFFLIVPGFMVYKVANLAKSFMGGSSGSTQVPKDKVALPSQEKSKRQTKLEQRGQRLQKVRTR